VLPVFHHDLLHVLQIFAFLVCLCLLCTVCAGLWENWYGAEFQEILPWDFFIPGSYASSDGPDESKTASGAAIIGIMTFFSYIIVLNTLVPISLYVRSVTLQSTPTCTKGLQPLTQARIDTGAWRHICPFQISALPPKNPTTSTIFADIILRYA